MLHVAELEALLFEMRFCGHKFLGLHIELVLKLVEVAIEHGNRLFEVVDVLLPCLNLTLILLDIIQEHGPIILATSIRRNCLLESLQELVLRMI